MARRYRLPHGDSLVVRKPKGRLKFESFGRLVDYMHSVGAAGTLNDIVDMEMNASKRVGQRVNRQEMQDRILMWWNTISEKPDAMGQRPSYVMTYMLREAAKKRSK